MKILFFSQTFSHLDKKFCEKYVRVPNVHQCLTLCFIRTCLPRHEDAQHLMLRLFSLRGEQVQLLINSKSEILWLYYLLWEEDFPRGSAIIT